MELVRTLFVFNVGRRNNGFKLINLVLQSFDLLFSSLFVLLQNRKSDFNFVLLEVHVAVVELVGSEVDKIIFLSVLRAYSNANFIFDELFLFI